MRNLCKYIIVSVTLVVSALFFGSVALAQSVSYDKYISGPNEDGVFTLNLEAYARGSVSVVTKPFDVILVLDRSGSMAYDIAGNEGGWGGIDEEYQRITILKDAVQKFVQNLKNTPVDQQYRDGYGGHRIAIVWFSGSWRNQYQGTTQDEIYEGGYFDEGFNELINVENLTTTPQSTQGRFTAAQVRYNRTNLLGVNASGGTMSNYGVRRAGTILSEQNYSDKPNRSRLVVFFTDGDPGMTGNWNDHCYQVANDCIQAAKEIKTSTNYKASIYSVGLFNKADGVRDRTTTYLSYTSSDYTDKTEMPSNENEYVPVSKDKSIIVSSSGSLNNIFTSIAENASNAASGSSILVDIVASNFKIPTNSSLGTVKVWEVPCTQQSATSFISFSPRNATGNLAWVNITNSVTLKTHANDPDNTPEGEVSVTGFDYGAKWCGWDASANNNQGAAHGSKLVLEIPISVNDDIVGGPSLETNLPGSGITVKDKNGEIIEEHQFKSPLVKVPVNIWIKKEGLLSYSKDGVQGHEDNAVFTIRKIKFIGRYQTGANGDPLLDDDNKPIKINYYFKKGEWDATHCPDLTINGQTINNVYWTTFTKVSVNMKEHPDGIAKISGLDPDYVYRIEEDAWAHLGYNFDPDATAKYTFEWDGDSVKDTKNPFVFSNTPKTNAFYSEDVIRNVFNPGSAAPTTTTP